MTDPRGIAAIYAAPIRPVVSGVTPSCNVTIDDRSGSSSRLTCGAESLQHSYDEPTYRTVADQPDGDPHPPASAGGPTGQPGIDLIALGGRYPTYDAFLGLRTSEAIHSLRADILFMSTTAVTEGNCYHQSWETVAVKRALMDSADRRFLLIDHTKFSKSGLHQLAPLAAFDLVTVDAGTRDAAVSALRAQGVPVQVAAPSGALGV